MKEQKHRDRVAGGQGCDIQVSDTHICAVRNAYDSKDKLENDRQFRLTIHVLDRLVASFLCPVRVRTGMSAPLITCYVMFWLSHSPNPTNPDTKYDDGSSSNRKANLED